MGIFFLELLFVLFRLNHKILLRRRLEGVNTYICVQSLICLFSFHTFCWFSLFYNLSLCVFTRSPSLFIRTFKRLAKVVGFFPFIYAYNLFFLLRLKPFYANKYTSYFNHQQSIFIQFSHSFIDTQSHQCKDRILCSRRTHLNIATKFTFGVQFVASLFLVKFLMHLLLVPVDEFP